MGRQSIRFVFGGARRYITTPSGVVSGLIGGVVTSTVIMLALA